MPKLVIQDIVYLGNGYAISQIDGKNGWYLHKPGRNAEPVLITKFANKEYAERFYYEWKHGGLASPNILPRREESAKKGDFPEF